MSALADARVDTLAVPTTHGEAAVRLLTPDPPGGATTGLVVLGHGAGGGVDAPDLQVVADVALGLGARVALVLQPYRAAGRKAPPRAPTLDAAWTEVVAVLRHEHPAGPLVVGGRSAGARVACRTAAVTGATAVLCLAFPVRPPGRPLAPDRLPELDAVEVPVLVVQGGRDPYGVPPAQPGRAVVTVRGDHALKADLGAVRAAGAAWLAEVLGAPAG